MQHVDAGHRLKQLALQMGGGSDTTRRHGELAGIGLGIGDELGDRPRWNREVRYHDVVHTGDASNRRDVVEEIVIELEQRRVDGTRRCNQQQRVTIWGCPHDRLGPDRGGRAWPVLDHKLLAEALRKPLSHQARGHVSRASGREWHDHPHRPRRIGLRPRETRHGWQRGSTRGQMQKISAGKFHC
jgi:hypothetical protein